MIKLNWHFLTMWKTRLRQTAAFVILLSVPVLEVFAESHDRIPNPITATNFPCLIKAITEAGVQIAVPLAVVAIIIAGVRFIFAGVRGSDAEITKAKTMLFWVVIGAAVVVGSFVIANAAVQFLGGQTTELAC